MASLASCGSCASRSAFCSLRSTKPKGLRDVFLGNTTAPHNFMKYLGIDHGGKRIGLAIGDDETHIAVPFETVEAGSLKEAVAAISLLLKEEGILKIVLGLPITLSGEESGQVEIVRKFGVALEKESGIKVEYEDERRSSKQAETLTRGLDMKNKDSVAAMVILQTYLDRMKNFKRV